MRLSHSLRRELLADGALITGIIGFIFLGVCIFVGRVAI